MSEPGTTIGSRQSSYRVVRELGKGGMGQVYEAVQTNLNRPVAVKMLRALAFDDEENSRRFVAEARILARLSHPNVVTLYDADLDHETPYLVMELVRGASLEQLIRRRGPLPLEEAIELSQGLLAGLEYLHASGVLHRDLKPENVLIAEGRVPKLADFGLARAAGTSRLTAEGFMVGTPMYMAPELMLGEEATARSDVYAFGVTLFRMLTGGFPIPPGPTSDFVRIKQGVTRAGLARRLAGQPAPLITILARCMAAGPADRFDSAATVGKALAATRPPAPDFVAPVKAAREAPEAAPVRPRSLRWMISIVCFSLLAVAGMLLLRQPLAARAEYRPVGLVKEARPGATRIRWFSGAAYASRVRAAGRVFGTGGPTRAHDVEVRPVPWASPPEAEILMPDGSRSAAFLLGARPLEVRPTIERQETGALFSLDLAEPEALRLEVRSAGVARAGIELPPAAAHRCRLSLPDPWRDYELSVRASGKGLLPLELPAVPLPSPRYYLLTLAEDIDALNVTELVRWLVVDSARKVPLASLRGRAAGALERIRWAERARTGASLSPLALGPSNPDRKFKATVISSLEHLLLIDQGCCYLGIELATGAREVLGSMWTSWVGEPPAGGQKIEVALEPPRKIVCRTLSHYEALAFGESADTHLDLALEVPQPSRHSRAYLTVRVEDVRPERMVRVQLNPVPKKKDDPGILLTYPRAEKPTGRVALTHALDPSWLRPGENRLRLYFESLPGSIAPRIFVAGATLTLH